MTADIALAAMAIVSLVNMTQTYRLHLKVADRLRIVSPPKDSAQSGAESKSAGTVEELGKRRSA